MTAADLLRFMSRGDPASDSEIVVIYWNGQHYERLQVRHALLQPAPDREGTDVALFVEAPRGAR